MFGMHVPVVALLASAIVIVGGIGTRPSGAQTIYRCESGGATSYSDRPCTSGAIRQLKTASQPPAVERAAARARLETQLAKDAARWQKRLAGAAVERQSPVPGSGDPRHEPKSCPSAIVSERGVPDKVPADFDESRILRVAAEADRS
jgi:hypothetical protein